MWTCSLDVDQRASMADGLYAFDEEEDCNRGRRACEGNHSQGLFRGPLERLFADIALDRLCSLDDTPHAQASVRGSSHSEHTCHLRR